MKIEFLKLTFLHHAIVFNASFGTLFLFVISGYLQEQRRSFTGGLIDE
jgi:hypothetical protein